jgi:hypothetical protein
LTAKSAPSTWRCPGCGAVVALPAECLAANVGPEGRRLDQLAQALCGCWVVTLPETGLVRLLGAIMDGQECKDSCRGWVVSERR